MVIVDLTSVMVSTVCHLFYPFLNIIATPVIIVVNSWFSCDAMAAMLEYRTVVKKVFCDFDSIMMQIMSNILPLFCTPKWPSHVGK